MVIASQQLPCVRTHSMKILSGNSNLPLAKVVSQHLNIPLIQATIKHFSDMEIFVEIHESVRGQDIFVIQSTSYPVNDNIMELLIIMDALKRGSAKRITAVIPYYGYSRQDRKSGLRTPISAKLVANLITVSGADRVLTFDLHTGQIQGFFDIPTDNLFVAPIFCADITKRHQQQSITIVSPDVGGVVRARLIAERIGADLAIIDKRRPQAGTCEVVNIIGNVAGKTCILIDDIIDSAGTICNAATALKEAGAHSIEAYVAHGVLSGNAIDRINQSPLESLTVSDTIDIKNNNPKIRILSISELLANVIRRISCEESVSSLLDF